MLTFKNINRLFIALLIILIICSFFTYISVFIWVGLLICWVTLTSIGSFNIIWNYHLNALNSNKNYKEKHVAISFDDGPNQTYTPQVLELLKKYDAKATFFCIGKSIEQNKDLLKEIANQGHTIGNHTFTHTPDFDFLGKQNVLNELNKTNQLIYDVLAKKPKLFRPPYGVTNPAISKAINETNFDVIGWNIRSLDTVKNNDQDILKRITKKIAPGSVILLHDSSDITVCVLEQLLLFLRNNGYKSVTIDTLFNIEAYA